MAQEYDAALLFKNKIDDSKASGDLLELEGKVTWISYRIPGGRSAWEVMRNHEKAWHRCEGHIATAAMRVLRQFGDYLDFEIESG